MDIKIKSDLPKYYIATFGCQMNHKDSQQMAGVLEALGFVRSKSLKNSDVVIINTCSVRQSSEDKVYGYGLIYKNIESKNKPLTFITGCMIGSAKGDRSRYNLEYLRKKLPWADYFLAPNEEYLLPKILYKEHLIDDWGLKSLKNHNFEINAKRSLVSKNESKTAFINISYGCDNFCTFCVVPYARGKEVSRPKDDILREVKHAVLRGYSNILLLGQNVNSWMLSPMQKLKTRKKIGNHPFADLLQEVHSIEGVKKIRFITSNPWDFTPHLVNTLKLPKIERFLHLPVQSGSNDILKAMNRRHTIEEYLELIEEIRQVVPDMQFGTDIIVGFPTESDEDFEKTLDLFRKVRFRVAYISIYSPRKGTPAFNHLKDDVPLKVKKDRHNKLMSLYKSLNG